MARIRTPFQMTMNNVNKDESSVIFFQQIVHDEQKENNNDNNNNNINNPMIDISSVKYIKNVSNLLFKQMLFSKHLLVC